jgi:peptidoglycan/xylan/chitin deacetylase (PgdA/CDA1 family)
VKTLLVTLARLTGVLRACAWINRRRLTILTYHGVLPRTNRCDPYLLRNVVDCDAFEWQMRYVATRCHVLSLSEACRRLAGGAPLPARAVVVTFDDGFRNNGTEAFPILRKYRVPATVFLTADYIGSVGRQLWTERVAWLVSCASGAPLQVAIGETGFALETRTAAEREGSARTLLAALKSVPIEARERIVSALESELGASVATPDRDRYEFLDWAEVRRMAAAGIEFGSHTVHHPILSSLDDDERWREVVESKRIIEEQLGQPCVLFSYPNGSAADFDARDERNLQRAGYACALSQIPGFNDGSTDRYALRRINIGRGHTNALFVAQLAGFWPVIERLGALVRRRGAPAARRGAPEALQGGLAK